MDPQTIDRLVEAVATGIEDAMGDATMGEQRTVAATARAISGRLADLGVEHSPGDFFSAAGLSDRGFPL